MLEVLIDIFEVSGGMLSDDLWEWMRGNLKLLVLLTNSENKIIQNNSKFTTKKASKFPRKT